MSVKTSIEFTVSAPPEAVMDLLRDIESLPQWSDPHDDATIVEVYDDGSPKRARLAMTAMGIKDEQLVEYTWGDNECSWTLVEPSTQLKEQSGRYQLTREGAGTVVNLEIEVDLKIKLPGFMVKQGQKMGMEAAEKGITSEMDKRS